VAGAQPILVRVGDIDLLVETVPAAGTQPTAGRAQKAAERVGDAFTHAQETIVEVAKSTAEMIGKTTGAARPDRVEVGFGLKFSANGNVIMAGVAAEASLQVTLSYDISGRPADASTPPAAGS
jgi:NTP-dependent ternary system trypsin peptidase co-occuring protein